MTEELSRKFQSSAFDTKATRRKFVEDHNTILALSGRVQELQNEVNCMNDSRDFKYAESVRSGQSHIASQPVSFPTCPRSRWPFYWNAEPQRWPPSIWDTHVFLGNFSANPAASSSAPFSAGVESMEF